MLLRFTNRPPSCASVQLSCQRSRPPTAMLLLSPATRSDTRNHEATPQMYDGDGTKQSQNGSATSEGSSTQTRLAEYAAPASMGLEAPGPKNLLNRSLSIVQG